jgi:hypothetical protein
MKRYLISVPLYAWLLAALILSAPPAILAGPLLAETPTPTSTLHAFHATEMPTATPTDFPTSEPRLTSTSVHILALTPSATSTLATSTGTAPAVVTVVINATVAPVQAIAAPTNTSPAPTATNTPVVRESGAGLPSVGLDFDWTWGIAALLAIGMVVLVRYLRGVLPKE